MAPGKAPKICIADGMVKTPVAKMTGAVVVRLGLSIAEGRRVNSH